MSTRIFGSGIRRREDPRLITGTATYTDDLTLPGMVHAAMLRSTHAHARLKRIDVSRAKKASGVLAVFTGADIGGDLKPMPCAWLLPNSNLKVANYPCIATNVVRYVGDIVAVVVAEDPYQAYDALEQIDVDYEPLPSVVLLRHVAVLACCLHVGGVEGSAAVFEGDDVIALGCDLGAAGESYLTETVGSGYCQFAYASPSDVGVDVTGVR